jgi:hypothetical protein
MGLRTSGTLEILLYTLFFFVVLSLLVIALKRGDINIGTYEVDTFYIRYEAGANDHHCAILIFLEANTRYAY